MIRVPGASPASAPCSNAKTPWKVRAFDLPFSDALAAVALSVVLTAYLLGPESDSWLESALMIGCTVVAVGIAGGPLRS